MTQPYQLAPAQVQKFFDNNGVPLASGFVYTYQAGTNNPQASYPSPTSGTPNPNPIQLNARGEAPVWLDPSLAYKINITDVNGNQIPGWPVDQIPGNLVTLTQAAVGLALYPQTPAEVGAGITPSNYAFAPGDIRRYGAVLGTDCTSQVTAAASCNTGVTFPSSGGGTWVINSTPVIPTGVILSCFPGAAFSGAGAGVLGFSTTYSVGIQYSDFAAKGPNAGVGELASLNFFRNATSTTGLSGNVANAIRIQTNVAAGVVNFEWGLLSVLNNSATGGQNVAGYFQGNKQTGAGPTWAGVFEAHDRSGSANPTSQLVGIEVDILADGADTNSSRVIADLVGGVGVSVGPTITYGLRIGPQNGVNSNAAFSNGIYLRGLYTRGITLALASPSVLGIDISSAVLSGAAIRIAQGQFYSLDATDTNRISYDGTGVGVFSTTNLLHRLNGDGSAQFGSTVAIPAGGSSAAAVKVSSTAAFGIFYGSGAPTLTAAQGSLYLRSDGSSTSTRLYVNTTGSNVWTNFTSAA